MNIDRVEAEKKLHEIFGIGHFYDEQWEAVRRIMSGERILMIQRTGFGKSLCFQFPATQFPGITVVFSPLIALMRDQVRSLQLRGIPAGYINSEQDIESNRATIRAALDGKLKILYIAPERQENEEWIAATRQMNISMVVIDEAHTISTWGHDFRPAFRRIIDLVKLLPSNLPVLATTATATYKVQSDIERQIGGFLTTIRGSLSRDNFRMYVIRVNSEDEKMLWLAENMRNLQGSGLAYCGRRVDTELYTKWLQFLGENVTEYHAGLDADTRKNIEGGLMTNRWKCIFTTNALGMGLDKPDIRFIIHTQIPVSPVHYYQEIGRAGRDGKPTDIILFYNATQREDRVPADMFLPKAFIEGARPAVTKYHKVIELLKEEPLGEREITKRANLKSNQIRVIKSDLIEQGIIREVKYDGHWKYELQINAPELDVSRFDRLRDAKLMDLQKMIGYVYTAEPRMKYLCNFLDSDQDRDFHNCDNTGLAPFPWLRREEYRHKLKEFYDSLYPELPTADTTTKSIENSKGVKVKLGFMVSGIGEYSIYKDGAFYRTYKGKIDVGDFDSVEFEALKKLWRQHSAKKSKIVNGVAGAYYGVSIVGEAIHRSKYEGGGDFPDFLLVTTLKAFRKKFWNKKFDMVVYVPPTYSGELVRHFAEKFAASIQVPISNDLVKTRATDAQKVFQNNYSKRDNVKGAFDFLHPEQLKDKLIILIDDIYVSGATIKEIGGMLTRHGAKAIVPVVIAKTIGGTMD